MNFSEINNKFSQLATSWEEFKKINDRRCEEITLKGSVDPLTLVQLERINGTINDNQDKLKSLLGSIGKVLNRPLIETKSFDSKNYYNNFDSSHVIPSPLCDNSNNQNHNSRLEIEYKNAFYQYLKKGTETKLAEIEKKSAFNGNSKNDFGYSITNQMYNHIDNSLQNLCPMRKLANVITLSTDALELLDEKELLTVGWSDEGLSASENSPAVQFVKHIIPVHELYAQPKATQKLIDDPRIDIEKWLADRLVEAFYQKENSAFINGDGVNKPKGILSINNDLNQIVCKTEEGISAENLIKLYYSLPDKYAANAKFLMSRASVQAIRMLKDNNSGRYLWQPTLSSSDNDKLLDSEIVISADMPNLVSGASPIVFADFKRAYHIVDREGIRILRDPFTHKPFVKFYSTKRVGGDIVDHNAIRVLKLLD